jgi:hypothetical protein
MQHKAKWVDAAQDRVISIVSSDSKHAICKSHSDCVMAKAIKRQTEAYWVDVGPRTVLIRYTPTGKVTRFTLNKLAQEQIRFFDTEGQFAPCLVTLHAPPPSKTLSAIRDSVKKSLSYLKRSKYKITRKPGSAKRKSLTTR